MSAGALGTDARSRQWDARSVNRSLLKQFLLMWLLVVVHLHGVMHDEVWPWGVLARIMAAAPPIVPVVFMSWGKVGPAVITTAASLAVAVTWWLAVRSPQVGHLRVQARTVIGVYWLVLWFPLALSA